jgi:hypothetical protein
MRFVFNLTIVLLSLCCFACDNQQPSAPETALKNYLDAARKGDADAMKQNLSAETLKIMRQAADAQKTTLDEYLLKDAQTSLAGKNAAPEMRNQQTNGDTATLEIKNAHTGGWDKIYFTRESGKWKIALDKMLQKTLENIEE